MTRSISLLVLTLAKAIITRSLSTETARNSSRRALPQDEAKLRAIINAVAGKGAVLLVVDQPSTIGALPVAVAQAEGILVGYIPGLAMRRIADLHPGEAKTDVPETQQSLLKPPDLCRTRCVRSSSPMKKAAELSMLCGFNDDLAKQATATSYRIRGLLTQIHPALERVIGPHLDHPAMVELLIKYPTPDKLRKAGQTLVTTLLSKYAPRAGNRWITDLFAALDEQTVAVSGTGAASIVLPQLAGMLKQLRTARDELLTQVEALVEAHAQHQRPVIHAGSRCEDRSTHHHRGDREAMTERQPPRLLRRAGTSDLALRDLDPRRSSLQKRQ